MRKEVYSVNNLFQKDNYGMRMHRFEILNWGGYTDESVVVDLDGKSILITGKNRSGKTTVLDAMVTLISKYPKFEQAVGGKRGGRSISSYVLGKYGDEKVTNSYGTELNAKSIRTTNTISIILGFFADNAGKSITAIQWFWYDGKQVSPSKLGTPNRRCAIVKGNVSIFNDLLLGNVRKEGQSISISVLNERIRNLCGVELFPTIEKYLSSLRNYLGISEIGLNSIANTIKVTKVDNINDYVRDRIEKTDFDSSFWELLEQCQNLQKIDDKIAESEDKVKILSPMVRIKGKKYRNEKEKEAKYIRLNDNYNHWVDSLKFDLSKKEISSLEEKVKTTEKEYDELLEQKKIIQNELDSVTKELAMVSGGNKLALEERIGRLKLELENISFVTKKFSKLCKKLNISAPTDKKSFDDVFVKVDSIRKELIDKKREIERSNIKANSRVNSIVQQIEEIENEISVLSERKSNISVGTLIERDKLAKILGMRAEDFPFVGELLDILPKEKAWEGAINKLLKSFAMTILVPADLYENVPKLVDRVTGKRIDYRKISDTDSLVSDVISNDSSIVCGKLRIKGNAPMTKWLANELRKRFSHKCTLSIEDFKKSNYALTINGQYRMGDYHVKDDRRPVNDASSYVIGFSNDAKISAKSNFIQKLQETIKELQPIIETTNNELREINDKYNAMKELHEFSWEKMDSKSIRSSLNSAEKTYKELCNNGSSKKLEDRRENLKKELDDNSELSKKIYRAKSNIEKYNETIKNLKKDMTELSKASVSFEIADMLKEYASHYYTKKVTLSSVETFRKTLEENIQGSLMIMHSEQGELTKSRKAVEQDMNEFLRKYPVHSESLQGNVDYLDDFEALLKQLEKDGLEFTKEYEEMFTRDFEQYLSGFSFNMKAAEESLKNKIDDLNRKLLQVEFRKERGKSKYMQIDYEQTKNRNISDFRDALRDVTKNIFQKNASVFQTKRESVHKIIDFLKSWKTKFERDRRAEALDIRNWFTYALKIIDENNNQVAYYSSTSGDSTGGQQSIASFLLVVSHLQFFNLAGNNPEESFRFVIMDELNESCDYDTGNHVLSLLERFGFQAVYVTPNNKIRQVSKYVGNIYHCRQHDDIEGVTLIRKVEHEVVANGHN